MANDYLIYRASCLLFFESTTNKECHTLKKNADFQLFFKIVRQAKWLEEAALVTLLVIITWHTFAHFMDTDGFISILTSLVLSHACLSCGSHITH